MPTTTRVQLTELREMSKQGCQRELAIASIMDGSRVGTGEPPEATGGARLGIREAAFGGEARRRRRRAGLPHRHGGVAVAVRLPVSGISVGYQPAPASVNV